LRFAAIQKGTRARKTVTIEGIEDPDGKPVPIDVRPLNGIEQGEALSKARAYAIEKGVKEPRDGEPIYELGKQVHTLLVGCIETDSPQDSPRPFFASAQEILELTRDQRCFLYEHQEMWEDWCAPRPSRLTDTELQKLATEMCAADEGDDSPFLRLRPVLRWSLLRTLALLHLISPAVKSEHGSSAETSGTSDTTSPTPEA
jgi:hypothetical protein